MTKVKYQDKEYCKVLIELGYKGLAVEFLTLCFGYTLEEANNKIDQWSKEK